MKQEKPTIVIEVSGGVVSYEAFGDVEVLVFDYDDDPNSERKCARLLKKLDKKYAIAETQLGRTLGLT